MIVLGKYMCVCVHACACVCVYLRPNLRDNTSQERSMTTVGSAAVLAKDSLSLFFLLAFMFVTEQKIGKKSIYIYMYTECRNIVVSVGVILLQELGRHPLSSTYKHNINNNINNNKKRPKAPFFFFFSLSLNGFTTRKNKDFIRADMTTH